MTIPPRRRPSIDAVARQGNTPRYELLPALAPMAERLHRRQRLAGALRLFGRYGFEVGLAGHFTARDPVLTDHFWVNPLGMAIGDIRASDLLLVGRTLDPITADAAVLHGDQVLFEPRRPLDLGVGEGRHVVAGQVVAAIAGYRPVVHVARNGLPRPYSVKGKLGANDRKMLIQCRAQILDRVEHA